MTALPTRHLRDADGPAVGPFAWWAALLGLTLLATFDAWSHMVALGLYDDEASHAMLVPLIGAWLFLLRIGRLEQIKLRPSLAGAAIVLLGAIVYCQGYRTFNLELRDLGAVIVAIGCTMAALGMRFFRAFAVAILIFLFMVPLPGSWRLGLTAPLQTLAAAATQTILGWMGLGSERFGNLLTINGVQVTVAEACAGMRMTWSLVLVSYAFAFTTPLRPTVRGLVILCSPVLAIVCNVVRLVPTVWVYGNFSTETADTFHDLSGWGMLFLGYVLLVGSVWLLDLIGVPVMAKRKKEAAA